MVYEVKVLLQVRDREVVEKLANLIKTAGSVLEDIGIDSCYILGGIPTDLSRFHYFRDGKSQMK